MTTTTIKVTTQTRDRLKAQAAIDGLTLGAHLDRLADAADRTARFARLRDALANMPVDVQHGYDLELVDWDSSDLTTPRA